MNGLSEREVNLLVSAIELVMAAGRGGDEHVTGWYDAILRRTATPAAATRDELTDLRRKLDAENLPGGEGTGARAAVL